MSQILALILLSCVAACAAQAILPVPPPIHCPIAACPALHLPVCGLLHQGNQKIYHTFGNACELNRYNCQHPKASYVQQGAAGRSCEDQHLRNICTAACTREFRPICGLQQGKYGLQVYKSFANQCQFWHANCVDPKNPFVQRGKDGQSCECQGLKSSCAVGCPRIYLPQCGRLDFAGLRIFTTFDNDCKLLQHNCEQPLLAFRAVGEPGRTCRQLAGGAAQRCGRVCDASYAPVCGVRELEERTEHRTFSNMCLLVQHNCRFPAYPFRVADNEQPDKTCKELGLLP